jgi:hypothetical protein
LLIRQLLKLVEKIGKFFLLLKVRIPNCFSRAEKNGVKWLVLKVWRFSFLIGMRSKDDVR